jgi:hypothetical protein
LNLCCALERDLESIFRVGVFKIVRNKIGHKRSSRLPHILLVSTSSARPDSKYVLSA